MTATPRTRTSSTALIHRDGAPPSADDPLLDFEPAPHVQLRRNAIGPERQRAFVAHLAATGIVTQAAKHIGASMEALYRLRRKPGAEGFAAAWDKAVESGVRRLEDCALARAIEGEERLVVSGGKILGTERRHNESLVMFLLRHRRADIYSGEVKPGHPLYERIREEVLAAKRYEEESSEAAVLARLNARLDAMRANEAAFKETLKLEREEKEAREAVAQAPHDEEEDATTSAKPALPGPRIHTIW